MSGFLAVRSDEAVSEDLVASLVRAGAYRGAATIWSEPGIALAAFAGRRGSGLAFGEDFCVAIDSRLDDRDELRRAVALEETASDAEIFLAAWRHWDAAVLHRIAGDFAGAVWDRAARKLTVFRDPIGCRPALIARAGPRCLAASEVGILLADPKVDRTLDEEWIAGFLATMGDFSTTSGYLGITRLQPPVLAESTGPAWRKRRWFEWSFKTVREPSDRAYADHLRELLSRAVRAQLEGVPRAGVALSGGMDSTSVAAIAGREHSRVVGLGIPFEDERGDERALQRAAANASGIELQWVPLNGRGPLGSGIAETFDRFGLPPRTPNWFHPDAIAEAASAARIEVVMDGIDADSLLAGHAAYLSDLFVTGRLRTYRREARALAARHNAPRSWLIKDQTIRPLIPTGLWMAGKRVLRRPSQVPGFISTAFARRLRIERLLAWEPWSIGRAYWTRERFAVSTRLLPSVLDELNVVYGRHGVEIAHPFLDRRVAEFCVGLPPAQKLRDGYTKLVLRNAMAGLLPQEILGRPDKADLSWPFFAGLLGICRPVIQEGLRLAAAKPFPWFEPEGLRLLSARFADGEDVFDAYRVACIAYWRAWNQPETPRVHAVRAALT